MAGTTLRRRLTWQLAEVTASRPETARAQRLVLDVPGWRAHVPGQHVDVRLTAEDGYRAQRSYSIASAPRGERVELVVERLDDGEVSPYLTDVLRAGDQLELRGPIGGYFVWTPDRGGPLQLIAGGSGVVPFLAMLDEHAATDGSVPVRLLYSARTLEDVIARAELAAHAARGAEITYTLTRSAPEGWTGSTRRVDRDLLARHVWVAAQRPLVFVCGPTPFVEHVATGLVELGHEPQRVKTERFGATGEPA
jgi:ferredoxin-NADP reductase